MPPVNQGSKAALITWTVVATVIGITCLVLALIFYVGRNDAEQRYQTLQRSYQEVATEADLTSPRVTDLVRQAKEEGGATAMTHLQIREETLANVAAGTTEYQQALARAEQLLSQLQGEPTNVQANSLTGAVEQLRTRVTELTQQSQRLTQTNQELEQAFAQARDNFTQQVETLQAQNEQTMQQLQDQQAIASGRTEAMDQLAQTTAQQIQEVTTLGGQENQTREQRIQELQAENERLQQQIQTLTRTYKLQPPNDQLLTAADGRIISSPTDGRIYIDLGRQDRVTTGMTFQVYDPLRGVPQADGDDLPRGKGSIQIIRVDDRGSSEARIVSTEPGQTIKNGDLIANLAYDRNVPVRVRIYGDFDLNNDTRTDPADRDRLLTLVREFGARVVDDVTVQTDLVVMGKEPVVPNYTEEELRDPGNVARQFEARQALQAYRDVQQKAQQLNIPILNQNQFLYYIGYFDQIRR